MTSNETYTWVITLCSSMLNTVWKLMAVQSECDIIFHHKFLQINNKLLICTSDSCENKLGDECSRNESIILLLYVGNELNNWGLVKTSMQKHRQCMKNSLCHETLVLLQRENLSSRKHINRAMYTIIVWENFGPNCSDSLSRKIS